MCEINLGEIEVRTSQTDLQENSLTGTRMVMGEYYARVESCHESKNCFMADTTIITFVKEKKSELILQCNVWLTFRNLLYDVKATQAFLIT